MKVLLALLCIATSAAAQDKNMDQYVVQHAKNMGDLHSGLLDLTFLDTALKDARIVMLGESSHGTEEYSQLKKQLISYLHERLGFNVVLFESPMTNCSYLNLATENDAGELVKNAVQSVWHTETVRQLFQYIKDSKISFGGFDPQHMVSPFPAKVYNAAFKDLPQINNRLQRLETRIAETIHIPKKYISLKDSFSRAYSSLAAALQDAQLSPFQQWIRQTMVVNAGYYTRINKGDQRDADMARNIIWLAENLYKKEKIIIWAHNTHIDKNATSPKRMMGKLLSDHFKHQLYGIGLYMTNGQTAENNREIITVKPPPAGSIEQMLGKAGVNTTFLPTADPIFNRSIPTLHWGKTIQKMNLYRSFDAVILIDGVTAPTYLPK